MDSKNTQIADLQAKLHQHVQKIDDLQASIGKAKKKQTGEVSDW